MKRLVLFLLAAGAVSCSLRQPLAPPRARKVDQITCTLRHCQLMVGGEFMAVALRGIEQPDLPGKCAAEGMLYVSADIFMNELFEKAKLIEVSEIGKEVVIHSGAFDSDYLLKEANIVVDGEDLAQLLADKGLALRYRAVTQKMKA